METYFEISDSGTFVKVEALDFIKYASDIDWDKSWIKCEVTVNAGAFAASYPADFRSNDFLYFRDQVEALYDNFSGGAMFYNLDGHLKIKIMGGGNGHFEVAVKASDKPNYGGELTFAFVIDQTYIKPIVKQLKEITEAFPVLGKLN